MRAFGPSPTTVHKSLGRNSPAGLNIRASGPTESARRMAFAWYIESKLNVFVMATEEKAPVEWAAERILGLRKRRLRDPARRSARMRPRGLAPPEGARRHGERPDRPRSPNPASPLADAFFIPGRGPSLIVSRRAEFPVAQRGPKWHTAPERRWLIPAL